VHPVGPYYTDKANTHNVTTNKRRKNITDKHKGIHVPKIHLVKEGSRYFVMGQM
jgi:hypothetical protein